MVLDALVCIRIHSASILGRGPLHVLEARQVALFRPDDADTARLPDVCISLVLRQAEAFHERRVDENIQVGDSI